MSNTADVTSGKPIAVFLQSISGVIAFNPLVAFYDIYGGKREVPFFYFVPDTTRQIIPHQNPLSSFKDLSIHRDRQREATLFYTTLWWAKCQRQVWLCVPPTLYPWRVSEISPRHIIPKWLSYETADVIGKSIAVWLQSISGESC
jgi:hypothetical protein